MAMHETYFSLGVLLERLGRAVGRSVWRIEWNVQDIHQSDNVTQFYRFT